MEPQFPLQPGHHELFFICINFGLWFDLTTVSDVFLAFLELSVEVMFCEGCGDGSFENAYSMDLLPMTLSDSLSVVTATLLRGTHTISSSGSSLSLLGEGAGVDD